MIIALLSLKVGDSSHISPENDVLCSIVNEEKKKESFTVVEIGGISSSHVTYLRQHLSSWTRQLALVEFYFWHLLKCICCAYVPWHTWRWIYCWSLISISKSCFYLLWFLRIFWMLESNLILFRSSLLEKLRLTWCLFCGVLC